MPQTNLITIDQALAVLTSHGCKPKRSGGEWKAKCPAHDGKTQSLSISEGNKGAVLFHCFSGCTFEDVLRALGLDQANTKRRIVATYDYDGHFETVRYSPKDFKQRRKTASGEWAWNLRGVGLRLYRQDDLMAAGVAAVWTQVATDMDSTAPLIGASGAIAGVVGAYLLTFRYPNTVWLVFVFFILPVIIGPIGAGVVSSGARVAYMAHLGGLVAGALMISGYKLLLRESLLPPTGWRPGRHLR